MEKLTGELERRELEQFCAVEREKTRWEKREELLQHQVKLLRETRRTEINRRTEDTPPRVRASASVQTDRGSPSATTEVQSQREDDTAMGSSESTPNVGEEPATSMLTSALLAHQLPPLSKFTGEGVHGSEGDTFGDWLEQFELCAGVCQWDARAKLLNLVTRLKGAAYSFYKSCSVQHRSDYGELVKELTRRFTPVRIQAVQCSLFHERKQSGKESVDDFSQDLRKLLAHAYSSTLLVSDQEPSVSPEHSTRNSWRLWSLEIQYPTEHSPLLPPSPPRLWSPDQALLPGYHW